MNTTKLVRQPERYVQHVSQNDAGAALSSDSAARASSASPYQGCKAWASSTSTSWTGSAMASRLSRYQDASIAACAPLAAAVIAWR